MFDGPGGPTDHAEVIDACDAAITEGELLGPPPKVIYHLTDGDGLHGILTNQVLWASLATGLNDALEVGHGVSVAMKLLNERIRKRESEYDTALIGFLLDPSAAPPAVQIEMFPLVTSFCARCDKSGQWLHYGRSGRGVAIGFSPELARVVSYDLVRVDYSPESQRLRMLRLIEAGAKAIDSDTRAASRDEHIQRARRTAHIVSLHVPQLSVRMKHPAFSEEEEWRLVSHVTSLRGVRQDVTSDRTALKYRRSAGRLIPYEELSFSARASEMIKEIVVGYSSEIALDAVKLLAQEQVLSPIVVRSDVPVR